MPEAENKKVDKARAKEEAQLAQHFLGVFQRRLDEIRSRTTIETFQIDDAEKQLLLQINNLGLMEGAISGIVTLALLRKVRSSFFKRLVQQRDRMMAQHHHQQYANHHTHPPPPHHHVHNSPFASQQQQQQYGGLNAPQQQMPLSSPEELTKLNQFIQKRSSPFTFANIFGWLLDGAVALSIAASTSLLFTDRKKILNTVSNIPLTPGRSQISKEFCPSLLQEMAALRRKDPHTADMLQHPQTATLQAFTDFAKNCQLRQSYEQQVRQHQGLSDTDSVVVPFPGVKEALRDAGYSSISNEFEKSDDHFSEPSFSSSSSDQFQARDEEDKYFDHSQSSHDSWKDEEFTTEEKNQNGATKRK